MAALDLSTPATGNTAGRATVARYGWGLGALAVVALAALPFFGNPYYVTFAFTVLIAYILGQSWDWVAGEMGYVNMGHYAFYGIGAYAFAVKRLG